MQKNLNPRRYEVVVKDSAHKSLESLPLKDLARVSARIAVLGINPWVGIKLNGKYSDFHAIRVWPYRVLYYIRNSDLTVFIVKIGHRKDIYK